MASSNVLVMLLAMATLVNFTCAVENSTQKQGITDSLTKTQDRLEKFNPFDRFKKWPFRNFHNEDGGGGDFHYHKVKGDGTVRNYRVEDGGLGDRFYHEVDGDGNIRNYGVEDGGEGDIYYHEIDEDGTVRNYHVEDGGQGDRVYQEVDADGNVRNYKVEDGGQGDMTFHEVDEYGNVRNYHVEDGGEGDRYYHEVEGDGSPFRRNYYYNNVHGGRNRFYDSESSSSESMDWDDFLFDLFDSLF
ncbi:uncharacterized protein LOC132731081 [Ruditapes philippinarum]|uniref:uncharacterized protein LOC132731081 n=1 Tax=Ruditapes philippinarum TaxID=129788 RepID=UPI00295AEFE7|nr:uncharacterized protein LOC132731081 [Ruditapes philippinarum]